MIADWTLEQFERACLLTYALYGSSYFNKALDQEFHEYDVIDALQVSARIEHRQDIGTFKEERK